MMGYICGSNVGPDKSSFITSPVQKVAWNDYKISTFWLLLIFDFKTHKKFSLYFL
jgi:hypothetical protein